MSHWLDFFRHTASPELDHFIKAMPVPECTAQSCDFVVLDIETTGLNPKRDHIISLGAIRISQLIIRPCNALGQMWQSPASVGDSALVHGITDEQLLAGTAPDEALAEFLDFANGAQLVAHHAIIEQQFLRKAFQEYYGQACQLPFIDTMQLEKQLVTRRHSVLKNDQYQLVACLQRYQLPAIKAHQAFEDAFGTAYLLLAQLAEFGEDVSLARLRQMSR